MLKFLTLSIVLVSSLLALSPYEAFYQNKVQELSFMKKTKLVFLGDSLTMRDNWSAFKASNLGIDGDTTKGVLKRISQTSGADTIVLMIGVNDILQGIHLSQTQDHYTKILSSLKKEQTVYILSLLPVIDDRQTKTINQNIKSMNKWLITKAKKEGLTYLNLYPLFLDNSQKGIKKEFTTDGIHLTAKAYKLWESNLKNILK